MKTRIKEIACPYCKKKFNYFSSPFRPFCSERCKLIDLGAWLDGSYSVEEKINPSEQSDLMEQSELETEQEESENE